MGFFKRLFGGAAAAEEENAAEETQPVLDSQETEKTESTEKGEEIVETEGNEPEKADEPETEDAVGTVSFDVYRVDGIRTMQMGQYAYAIECFKRALAIEEDEEVHGFLVSAYLRSDNLPLAAEELEKMCNLYRRTDEHKIHLANVYYQMEKYAEAIALCETLKESKPELAFPNYLLAKICVAQGDWAGAEPHVSSAIEKRDDFEEAYLLRSQVLLQLGNNEEALSDVDHLLSIDENQDEWLLQKGKLLEAMGRQEEAIIYYNKVIAENPFVEDAYAQLAQLHLQAGVLKEAEEVLEDGLEQNGERPRLILVRAALKEAQGDTEDAEEDRKLAAELEAEEANHEEEDYDVEREMEERLSAINPLQ